MKRALRFLATLIAMSCVVEILGIKIRGLPAILISILLVLYTGTMSP